MQVTRGTETSQYPEEEKSTEIARVVASESAQKPKPHVSVIPSGGCHSGVVGHMSLKARVFKRSMCHRYSKTAWEGRPKRVKAPYAK